MSFTAIRDEVKTLLLTVSGVNVVNSFPRLDNNNHLQRWVKQFASDSHGINCWFIQRVNSRNSFMTSNETKLQPTIMLTGLYQHNDDQATYDAFDDLVDSIMELFFQNHRLQGGVDIQGPPQLVVEELRQIAGVVCHYCEMTITAVHRFVRTP